MASCCHWPNSKGAATGGAGALRVWGIGAGAGAGAATTLRGAATGRVTGATAGLGAGVEDEDAPGVADGAGDAEPDAPPPPSFASRFSRIYDLGSVSRQTSYSSQPYPVCLFLRGRTWWWRWIVRHDGKSESGGEPNGTRLIADRGRACPSSPLVLRAIVSAVSFGIGSVLGIQQIMNNSHACLSNMARSTNRETHTGKKRIQGDTEGR